MQQLHLADEHLVRGEGLHPLGGNGGQEFDGVLADGDPELRVNGPKEVLRRLVPRPPKVVGQSLEGIDLFREHRLYGETTICTHGLKLPPDNHLSESRGR